jgi:hypothetical protein
MLKSGPLHAVQRASLGSDGVILRGKDTWDVDVDKKHTLNTI